MLIALALGKNSCVFRLGGFSYGQTRRFHWRLVFRCDHTRLRQSNLTSGTIIGAECSVPFTPGGLGGAARNNCNFETGKPQPPRASGPALNWHDLEWTKSYSTPAPLVRCSFFAYSGAAWLSIRRGGSDSVLATPAFTAD